MVATGATAGFASIDTAQLSGPWPLALIPEMGTVTWSCDGRAAGVRSYALGLGTAGVEATERVTLRAGGRVIEAVTVNRGQPVRFPHLGYARQELSMSQTTQPGTLRATVNVDFGPGHVSPSHCFPWLPPAVTVHLYPR